MLSVTQLPYQNIYEIEIASDNIAAFVWLDAHNLDGKFSENGFFMMESTKSVYFYPEKDYKIHEIRDNIDVTHATQPKSYSGSYSFRQNVQNIIVLVSVFQIFKVFIL